VGDQARIDIHKMENAQEVASDKFRMWAGKNYDI